MARRIFDTYHAPDDEIEGVKHALDEASVNWFETLKGRWWVGSAGLWVSDDDQYQRARQVIEAFQSSWRESARNAQLVTQSEVSARSVRWSLTPVLAVVVGLILYFTLFWFWL